MGQQILQVVNVLTELAKKKDKDKSGTEFNESLAHLVTHLNKLSSVSKELNLTNECRRVETLAQMFTTRVSAAFREDKDYPLLDIDKTRMEEALWWFLLLEEQKEKILQDQINVLKEREQQLSNEVRDNLSF